MGWEDVWIDLLKAMQIPMSGKEKAFFVCQKAGRET